MVNEPILLANARENTIAGFLRNNQNIYGDTSIFLDDDNSFVQLVQMLNAD